MHSNSRLAEAASEAPTIDYDPECQRQDIGGAYRLLDQTRPGPGLVHHR